MFDLAKKYLIKEKRNSVTIVIVAILSIMLVSITCTLKEQDYIERKNLYYKNNPEYNLILSANQKIAYDVIRNDKDIDEVTVSATKNVNANGIQLVGKVYDKEYIDKLIKVDILTGRLPENENEVIVANSSISELGNLKKGEKLELENKLFNIVGIYNVEESKNDLPSVIAVGSKEQIINNNEKITYYADYPIERGFGLTIKDGPWGTYKRKLYNKVYDLIDKINQKEEGENERLIATEEEINAVIDSQSMISSLSQEVLIILIAIFTVLAMRNAFNMSIISKVKLLGTLKAIGAEPKQIRKLILSEVILLFIISLPIGLMLGMISSKIVAYMASVFLGYSIYNISLYNIIYVILGSCIMLIITMLIASNGARNIAYELTAIEAMTASKSYKGDEYITGVNSEFINKHCNIEIILADKNISNNAKKYRICFLTLAVAMTLLAFMANKLSISDMNAKREYLYSTNWNVDITSHKPFSNEEIEDLKKISNSVYNENEEETFISIPNDKFQYNLKEMYDYGYGGDEVGNRLFNLNMIYGNKDVIDLCKNYIEDGTIDYDSYSINDIILVNKAQLELAGANLQSANSYKYEDVTYYKVGDKIQLQDGREYNIKAIISENPLSNLVVNSTTRNQINRMYAISLDKYSNITNNKMHIQIDDKSNDLIMAKLKLLSEEKSYTIFNRYDKVNEIAELNKKYSLIDLMFVISIVLILVINLVNTLTTAIVVRKSEIAALRAIGMDENQVKKNIISEGTIVCIYSGVIGALLSSVYLFFRKNEFLNQGGIQYDVVGYIIFGVFVAQIIIGIVSSIKPLKSIMSNSIVEDISN